MIKRAIHKVLHSGYEEDFTKKVTQGVGEAIQKWFHLLKILCIHFCFNLVFVPLYPMGLWYYNKQQKQHFQEAVGASDNYLYYKVQSIKFHHFVDTCC